MVPTKQAAEGETSEDKAWLLVLPARVSHPSLEPQFPQCKVHPHIHTFPYCVSTHYILGPILEAKDRVLRGVFTNQYRRQTISEIKDTLSDFGDNQGWNDRSSWEAGQGGNFRMEIREQASWRRWHLNRPEAGKGMIHTDLQQPGEQLMQRP